MTTVDAMMFLFQTRSEDIRHFFHRKHQEEATPLIIPKACYLPCSFGMDLKSDSSLKEIKAKYPAAFAQEVDILTFAFRCQKRWICCRVSWTDKTIQILDNGNPCAVTAGWSARIWEMSKIFASKLYNCKHDTSVNIPPASTTLGLKLGPYLGQYFQFQPAAIDSGIFCILCIFYMTMEALIIATSNSTSNLRTKFAIWVLSEQLPI